MKNVGLLLITIAVLFSSSIAHALAATKPATNRASEWSREGEFLIDTNVVYVPTAAGEPSVAFDGTNYLVVWQDIRRLSGFNSDIYGARVDPSGNVLDQIGIAICTVPRVQFHPSVAFGGTNYLVVWWDNRNNDDQIYGARVDPSGNILDPDGILIRCNLVNIRDPLSVAFDGANYLVVWGGGYIGDDIYGTHVDTSGTAWTFVFPISTAAEFQGLPSAAFDGTNYLVVWQDERSGSDCDIYGARVSPSWEVLDPSGIALSTATDNQESPSVAFDGTDYLVVWQDRRSGFDYDICGTRMSPSGVVLDPSGIAIFTGTRDQGLPALAFDGTNSLVVGAGRGIEGARVDQSGNVLDPDGFTISSAAYRQSSPSAAFDSMNYFVVWNDGRNGTDNNIYGARVDQGGNLLDPSGITISAAANDQQNAAICFNGTDYLVVWQDDCGVAYEDDIYGTRVSPNGAVLDTMGIAISAAVRAQVSPSLASDGVNYLVVWQDGRYCSTPDIAPQIRGTRVNQSGTVLDTNGIAITQGIEFTGDYVPAVAFDGTNYLVVWEETQAYMPWWNYICGVRVDTSGTVLDPVFLISPTEYYGSQNPAIAFDGTNYLVVWTHFHSGNFEIYGARVDESGMVLDPSPITISESGHQLVSPSVTYDGTDYIVVWREDQEYFPGDIYGAKLNTSGTLIDSFAVSLQPGDQTAPTLAPGIGDQVLFAYSGWVDSINSRPAETMRIWGKFYPFFEIEEDAEFTIHDTRLGLQIHPNPFSNFIDITFSIGHKAKNIELKIYDVTGRLVKDYSGQLSVIRRQLSVRWSGNDDYGNRLPNGIYFVTLKGDNHSIIEKLLFIR